MQVTFAITADDFWRYNQFVVHRVPRLRLRFYLRLATLPILVACLSVLEWRSALICLLAGAATAAVWVPFLLWNSRRRIGLSLRDVPGMLTPVTVRLLPDGLHQQASNSEALQKWASFTEIVQNTDQILFFLNQRYAQIVPKAAFVDPDQARQFYEAALLYWNSAKAGQPPPALAPSGTWPPPPSTGP